MIEDIRVMLDRNHLAREAKRSDGNGTGAGATENEVPIIFGGPLDQDRVGSVAARTIRQMLRGPRIVQLFRSFDLAVLDWFTSVSTASGPDIMSYLLFEPTFIEGALRAGIEDATALINDYPDPGMLWGALRDREHRHATAQPRRTLWAGMNTGLTPPPA